VRPVVASGTVFQQPYLDDRRALDRTILESGVARGDVDLDLSSTNSITPAKIIIHGGRIATLDPGAAVRLGAGHRSWTSACDWEISTG
jgi:hypothetical protein